MYVCYSWLQVHHLLRIDLFLRLWPWSLCQVSSWIQPLPLWPEIRSCRNPGCCCTRSSCWGSPPTKLQANAPVVDVQLVGTWAHRWPLHISVRRLPARLLCCKNVWLRKYVTVIVCQCISGLDVWKAAKKKWLAFSQSYSLANFATQSNIHCQCSPCCGPSPFRRLRCFHRSAPADSSPFLKPRAKQHGHPGWIGRPWIPWRQLMAAVCFIKTWDLLRSSPKAPRWHSSGHRPGVNPLLWGWQCQCCIFPKSENAGSGHKT